MSEQGRRGEGGRLKKKLAIVGGLVILVVGVVVVLMEPPYKGLRTICWPIKEVNHVTQMVQACSTFAADNDGRFPDKLKDLYPDYIDYENFFNAYDGEGRSLGALVYFPGQSDLGFSRSILIAYPAVIDNSRVVGYVGGHVVKMKEKEYQKLIAANKDGK